MPDNRTQAQRRATMQAVRGSDTQPEWIVRRLLHGLGYRYRLHVKNLPGKPDIAFSKRKKAIFVHGCFWHAHGCGIGQPPKSKLDYWLPKLEQNRQRDARKAKELCDMGWKTLMIWQCELEDIRALKKKLKSFLEER